MRVGIWRRPPPHTPFWAVRRARGFRPAWAHLQILVHLFLTAPGPLGGEEGTALTACGCTWAQIGVGWAQCSLPVGALGLPELTALRCRNQLCSDEKTGEKGSCSSPVLVLKGVLTWEEKTFRHSHWASDLPARVHSGVSAGWAGLRCDQVHHC